MSYCTERGAASAMRRSTSGDPGLAGWSDARKLKALEEENRRLKKLLADTMLDAATLKEMLAKNF
jgi:putative transposase